MEEKIKPTLAPVEIRTPQGDFLRVSPEGTKITLSIENIPILTSVIRGDGKRGITHPCSPIFGPDVNSVYGLSQHGNMRNEQCKVKLTNPNEITVNHEITDIGYPSGMKAQQILRIENGTFFLSFTHKNTGKDGVAVNAAEHCYFDAPNGYLGATINGQDIAGIIQNSLTGVLIDLKVENSIKISGKPELILKQEGFNKVALWVGRDSEGNRDKNYICIEPVEHHPKKFGIEESIIHPGSQRTAHFSLRKKK